MTTSPGVAHDLDETFLLYETIDHSVDVSFIMCIKVFAPLIFEQLSFQAAWAFFWFGYCVVDSVIWRWGFPCFRLSTEVGTPIPPARPYA